MSNQFGANDQSANRYDAERRALAGHFDASFYLASNPDVRAAGVDPLEHFIASGWREGRNPSSSFDVHYYLSRYPDVAAADINPLVHYVQSGAREGRLPRRPHDGIRRTLDASLPLRERAARWEAIADHSPPISSDTLTHALYRAGGAGFVLSFSHDDYARAVGGVQVFIGDEQRAFHHLGWSYLHVSPAAPRPMLADQASMEDFGVGLRLDGERLGVAVFADLISAVAQLREKDRRFECVVHHFLGHSPELVLDLVRASGTARPIIWVHDFFSYCSSHALMRNDICFCGGPPPESAACGICCYGDGRKAHMARVAAFFETTTPTVLAPSTAALERWKRLGTLSHAEAKELPIARLLLVTGSSTDSRREPGHPLRIAHVGSRTFHKGWLVFEELAVRFADDGRFAFFQLGLSDGEPALPGNIRNISVRVTGESRNAMVEAIAEARIDVVVSWSTWPETFCIAVHEALSGGAFIVARADAGNVWPAVETNAPGQGVAVADEAGLSALFEGNRLRSLVEASPRLRGAVVPGRGTAEWLVPSRRERPPFLR